MRRLSYLGATVLLLFGAGGVLFASGGGEPEEAVPFNETGYPIVDEGYELTIRTYLEPFHRVTDFNDLPTVQDFEERTNIRVNWELSPSQDWDQALSLLLASGDYPDILFNGNANTTVVGASEGVWLPLQDLIADYAPVIQAGLDEYPALRQAMTLADGNIYALGGMGPWHFQQNGATQGQLLINRLWLDALDLQMPTTIEEYYDTLLAFRDGDPNGNGEADEIPLLFDGSNLNSPYFSWRPLAGSFGIAIGNGWVDVKDGEYLFVPTTENYREFIRFMRRLYQERLLDQETFLIDFNQYLAKGKDEDGILGSVVGISGLLLFGPRVFEDWAALSPPEVEGYERVYPVETGGFLLNEAYISTQASSPEIAMRWLGAYAEHDNLVNLHLGEVGFLIERVGDMTVTNVEVEGMTEQEARHARSPGISAPNLQYPGVNNIYQATPHAQLMASHFPAYAPFADMEYRGQATLSVDLTQEFNELATNINNVVEQKAAEWIMQGGLDNEWDQFVRELNNAGLERYMEIFREHIPIVTREEPWTW